MDESTFSRRLRETRESRGLNQETLAGLCGLKGRTIQRWEAGVTEPQIDDAAKVARALRVSLDFLVGVEKVA